MKKFILSLVSFCIVLLSACGGSTAPASARFSIAATTYPVYLLTQMVTEGAEDLSITTIVNQSTGCPHEYALSVNDMKAVEQADILIQNGAGLEPFLSDVFAACPDLPVIDCSRDIALLPYQGHDHAHTASENDPHIWMDPSRAAQMAETIGAGLAEADPANGDLYLQNASAAARQLREYADTAFRRLESLACRELITFHDGFGYLADAFDLTILRSIEEEAGSEVSAREIAEITALVKEKNLPAVFCETNGSDSAANTIARETGAKVGTLTLMLEPPAQPEASGAYYALMDQNVEALLTMLQPEGGLS